MKRITAILIFAALSISLSAQNHLKFKNIPIEGKKTSFIEKLKAAGYTVKVNNETRVILDGSFAGFDNCIIAVHCSESSKTVWKVEVLLPDQASWSSTCSRYEDYKERYTTKYGLPSESYEFFIDPYERGDGYELQAIAHEKGFYISYWTRDEGIILLEIDASSNSRGRIRLGYEDAHGKDIHKKEKEQLISNDL